MSVLVLSCFYKRYTGGRLSFQVDDGPLTDALLGLTGQFPELNRVLFSEDGALRGNVMFRVNGEYCRHDKLSKMNLNGDSVEVHPILTGG